MPKTEKTCPVCLKRVSRKRPPLDAGTLTIAGWQKRCRFCGSLLFIPLDEAKPIEAVIIEASDSRPFEQESIYFDEGIKLLG